jgi:hypothetical protein
MNAKLTERLDDFRDVANRRVSAFGRRDCGFQPSSRSRLRAATKSALKQAIIYRVKNPPRLVPMTPVQSQTREVRCGSQLSRQCPLMHRQIKGALEALFGLSRFGRLSRHQNRSPHSKQFRQNEQIPTPFDGCDGSVGSSYHGFVPAHSLNALRAVLRSRFQRNTRIVKTSTMHTVTG